MKKVIAINGSPRRGGNTSYALDVMAQQFMQHDVELEVIQIGHKVVRGCISCYKCREENAQGCIFDDEVNVVAQKISEADGIILASPVYFAGINGTMKSFLDRLFYSASSRGIFKDKVASAIVALRRGGASSAFSALNFYLHISQTRMVGSIYWNSIHGRNPGEAANDEEGINTMKQLAVNMAVELHKQ